METPDNEPDTVAQADERVERAKESLTSRIEEIGRRFQTAKNMGNIADRIAKNPWPAMGIAAALGAFAGFSRHLARADDDDGEHQLRNTVMAGAGALLLRLVKSY
ncbi:MAG: hypothetical protein ABI175_08690, partial [Polyangiales bacterium]